VTPGTEAVTEPKEERRGEIHKGTEEGRLKEEKERNKRKVKHKEAEEQSRKGK
jgi:hypothetical protein